MPSLLAAVLAASSKSSTTTTSGGSAFSLLILFVFVLGAYFLFIRPRSQAARRQREDLQEVVAGDEVLTAAGIFGTVLDVAADRVTLETAPGTRITVLKSTIARRITPQTVDDEQWEEHGSDWEADDEAGPHEEHQDHEDHDEAPGTGEEGSR